MARVLQTGGDCKKLTRSTPTATWLHLLPAGWFSRWFWTSVTATALSQLSVLLLRVTVSRQIQQQSLCICLCMCVCVCEMRMKSISQFPAARAVSVSCQRRGGNYGTCYVEGKPGHQGGIRTSQSLLSSALRFFPLLHLPPPSIFTKPVNLYFDWVWYVIRNNLKCIWLLVLKMYTYVSCIALRPWIDSHIFQPKEG